MSSDKEYKKTQAEIDATVEQSKAEAAQALAEAKRATAEAAVFKAEARQAEAKSRIAEIELEKKERAYADDKADDDYHHVYRFDGTVDASSVTNCVKVLTRWDRTDPKCDIELIFKSPGGSIIDGMALYDVILELREKGHHVTTMTRGWAASMAGILLQAGDTRVMGKEAYVLIHEAAFAAMGKTGDVEDTLELIHKMQDNVLDIFAERAKGTGRTTALSRSGFAKRWRRKDWWLNAADAYKYGVVDEVR